MQEHTVNCKQDITDFWSCYSWVWEIHPTQVYMTYLNLRGATGCAGPLNPSALIVMIPWFSSSMHQVTWTSPESCDRSVLPAHGYRSSWLPRSALCDIIEDTQTNVSSSLRRDLSKDTTKVVNQWVSLGGLLNYSCITKTHPVQHGGWLKETSHLECSARVLRASSRSQSSSQSLSAVLTWMLEGGEVGLEIRLDFLKLLSCLLCFP